MAVVGVGQFQPLNGGIDGCHGVGDWRHVHIGERLRERRSQQVKPGPVDDGGLDLRAGPARPRS